MAVLALVAKHAAENLLNAQAHRRKSKNKGGSRLHVTIARLERRQTAADERYECALTRLRDLAASAQRIADPLEQMLVENRRGILRSAQPRPNGGKRSPRDGGAVVPEVVGVDLNISPSDGAP